MTSIPAQADPRCGRTVTGGVVKTFHFTGDGGRIRQRISIPTLYRVHEVTGLTADKDTRSPPRTDRYRCIRRGTRRRWCGEADRVSDLVTHLGKGRACLGDLDRRCDQIHTVVGTVTGGVVKTFHRTGDGGRIQQRIGIPTLYRVHEVTGLTADKDTEVTQQGIVTGAYAEEPAVCCCSEADRVSDLVTDLGKGRTCPW